MSLWDADGDYYSSRRDLQLAYTPPKSDLPGAAVALSLIACWVSGRFLFCCYCCPCLDTGCHVPARHVP